MVPSLKLDQWNGWIFDKVQNGSMYFVEQLKKGAIEATYGLSTDMRRADPEQLDAIFKQMNQPR